MKYRQIGESTLQVSELSVGGMSLGTDQKKIDQIINLAVDHGINLIDTADLYDKGWNEKRIGIAIRGKREKVLLSTKVGNVWNDDGQSWHWNPSRKHILSAVDSSLSSLGTDYIDIYQLHGGTIKDPIDEIIETFERLKEQGKIMAYGLSSIRPNVIREFVQRSNIDSVMIQYSLLDRRPEENVLKFLEEKNVSVLARGVLGKGLLAGKPPANYLNYTAEEISGIQDQLIALGNPMDAAFSFALRNKVVASLVVGVSTYLQLKEALKAYDALSVEGPSLSDITEPAFYVKHR